MCNPYNFPLFILYSVLPLAEVDYIGIINSSKIEMPQWGIIPAQAPGKKNTIALFCLQ